MGSATGLTSPLTACWPCYKLVFIFHIVRQPLENASIRGLVRLLSEMIIPWLLILGDLKQIVVLAGPLRVACMMRMFSLMGRNDFGLLRLVWVLPATYFLGCLERQLLKSYAWVVKPIFVLNLIGVIGLRIDMLYAPTNVWIPCTVWSMRKNIEGSRNLVRLVEFSLISWLFRVLSRLGLVLMRIFVNTLRFGWIFGIIWVHRHWPFILYKNW